MEKLIKEMQKDTDEGEISLMSAANAACKHLPDGWVVSLSMENGAAWVEIAGPDRGFINYDSSDRSIVEQLNDAICIANGWEI